MERLNWNVLQGVTMTMIASVNATERRQHVEKVWVRLWTDIFISCPFNTHDMDLKPVFQTRHYFKVVRVAPTVLRAVTTVTTQFVICRMKMQF